MVIRAIAMPTAEDWSVAVRADHASARPKLHFLPRSVAIENENCGTVFTYELVSAVSLKSIFSG
jgi:hypothetical protein